jgi:hypothetical protein
MSHPTQESPGFRHGQKAHSPEPATATAGPPTATESPTTRLSASAPVPTVLTRRAPPVAELVVGSVILMLTGGVYLAASLPRPPALAPAIALVAAGAVLTVAAVIVLVRTHDLNWSRFFQVVRWAMVGYGVFAGMLVYVFVYDHTPDSTLGVLIATLVVFAVDVPLVLAFTVAWFQQDR